MKIFGISSRFRLLFPSSGQVSHVLRTRSPLDLPEQAPWISFDLHVLSVPPAFVLSQDQTLQQKRVVTLSGCLEIRTIECRAWSRLECSSSTILTYSFVADQGRSTTKLTSRSVSRTPEGARPDVLPALAFCLLFRFQGAEALAHLGGDLAACLAWCRSLFRGREAAVERREILARNPGCATRVRKKPGAGGGTSSHVAAAGTCRAAVHAR